jgi:hypothetical protein
MSQSFPPPPIQPVEQFHVKDGLLINAERWRRAHGYHQQQQSMLYQSLNQPGIVTGLGIHLITAPEDVPPKYRDQRWLELQPGLAIDLAGNLIVVPHPVVYRIVAGETPAAEPLTVYLTVSHVDPKSLDRREQSEILQETFRIDESTQAPTGRELEVCRVLLQPGAVELQRPPDVLSPQINQIDLRFRLQAKARPQAMAQVALVHPLNQNLSPTTAMTQRYLANFDALLDSLEGLYPALGREAVGQVCLSDSQVTPGLNPVSNYNLLFAYHATALALEPSEIEMIRTHIEVGGIFVVEAGADAPRPFEFINHLSDRLNISLENINNLPELHPIKRKPFLFSDLPTFSNQKIQILSGAGVVVLLGDLSSFWGGGGNQDLAIPRADLRAAQELGINLLYFASQRKSLSQLLSAAA